MTVVVSVLTHDHLSHLPEYAHQIRSGTDYFVVAVKLHDEAGQATDDDLAMPVRPGGQCPMVLARGDLLDPALRRDRMAI